MSLAQTYYPGQRVFLKKMGLPVFVVEFHRGAPNRYSVSISGTVVLVTEKQLAANSQGLALGTPRRRSKYKPGDLVLLKDNHVALVRSTHRYRKTFRYELVTPSRNLIADEIEISARLQRKANLDKARRSEDGLRSFS